MNSILITTPKAAAGKNLPLVIGLQSLAAFITLIPLCFIYLPTFIGNSDSLYYATILRITGESLRHGQLLPGWLAEANGNSGSPILYYYSLLAYQLTALIGMPIGNIDPFGWKRMVLGMFCAQLLGGICCWLWLRRHSSGKAAIIGSLAFTLISYKWVYLYLHINLAQLWALCWIPLLMICAEDIVSRKKNAVIFYAVCLALLTLTHPRTLVAVAWVPGLYAFLFTPRAERGNCLLQLIIAHLLCIGLTAFYLLPAVLNLSYIQSEAAQSGRFNYRSNLNHSDLLLNFHYAVLVTLLAGIMLRLPQWRKTLAGRQAIFWVGIIGIAAFLCTSLSQPIWDKLILLQFLQFPVARLHAVALLGGCFLLSQLLSLYPKSNLPSFYSPYIYLLAVAATTGLTWHRVGLVYRQPNTIDWAYIEQIHKNNVILTPESVTRWQQLGDNNLEQAKYFASLPLASIIKGVGTVDARLHDNTHIMLSATIDSNTAVLRVRQLYWPFWRSNEFTPEAGKDGLLQLNLPKGSHTFTIELLPPRGVTAGLSFSLAAALIALIWLAYNQRSLFRRANSSSTVAGLP